VFFCLEMYHNKVFLFLKTIFDINTSKQSENIILFLFKKIKIKKIQFAPHSLYFYFILEGKLGIIIKIKLKQAPFAMANLRAFDLAFQLEFLIVLKNYFFMFLSYFNMLISKINFKK